MISLTKELENSLNYQGIVYPLKLNYDNVLRWYELFDDPDIKDTEKIAVAFEMFTGSCAINSEFMIKAIKAIEDHIQSSAYGNQASKDDPDSYDPIRFYSYQQDAEAIYASFLSQYGIDLVEQQGKLHWDKFKAMLIGLDEHTIFKRIINIRMQPLSGDLDQEQLTQLTELQAYYGLKQNQSVDGKNKAMETQVNDIFNALKEQALT